MFQGSAIEIPLGQAGLSGNLNHADLTPAHLVSAQNVSYWTGLIRRESGAILHAALSGAVTSGFSWLGDTRSVVTLSGATTAELRKDTGSGTFSTVLASGLGLFNLLPNYTTGGEEDPGRPTLLFCALSPNAPRVVIGDADTATLIPEAPVEFGTGPAAFVNHEGRMWAIGSGADPHRVYFSSTADHLKFLAADGGGQILVYPGEGERIVAGLSFKGLLVLWKFPAGIYVIDTSEVDVVNWRVRRISAHIGTRGPGCVTMIDSDVIFLDSQGSVQLLSGITEYGQVGNADITDAYDLGGRIRLDYRPERFPFSSVQFCPARREVHITLCQRGQTSENVRLVIDLNRTGQYRFRLVTRDQCSALWLRRDQEHTQRPMVGGADGRIWLLDQSGVQRVGVGGVDDPAPSAAVTPEMDLGAPTQRKSGKFLEVYLGREEPSRFVIEVYWDGILRHTIPFLMPETGWPLGDAPNPFTLDTSWLGGGSIAMVKRMRLLGSGRRLQLRVLSHGTGNDFLISRLYVSVAGSNQREPTERGTVTVHGGGGVGPMATGRGGRA